MKTFGTIAVAFAAVVLLGTLPVHAGDTAANGSSDADALAVDQKQPRQHSKAYRKWAKHLRNAEDATYRALIIEEIARRDIKRLLNAVEEAVGDGVSRHKPAAIQIFAALGVVLRELGPISLAHADDTDDADVNSGRRALLTEFVINHPDPRVRLNALEQLAELEDQLFVLLRDHVLANADPLTRIRGLSIAERLYNQELIAAVGAALTDNDEALRQDGLLLLGAMERDDYFPADILVQIGANDPSAELRMGALELLASAGGDIAVISLTQALSDPDPRVVSFAVDMLSEL